MITHASLFSGIGAAELAAEWMGWRNAFHCEIQEFPRTVLRYWFPEETSYEDITKTDFAPWRGRIDVLTGGFPCQPFSCAGKRQGADDDRYLWPEMLRAIREIQPSWVVGENVAGILSMVQPGSESEMGSEGTLFGEDNEIWERRQQYVVETVCQDLENEGYSVQPFVIPACAVGAPHRRDRVFFVARRVASDTRRHGGQEEAERGRAKAEEAHEQPEPVFDSGVVADLSDTGVEAMQQGRQDGVHAIGTPAHTHRDRFWKREDEQEPVGEREGTPHDCAYGKDGASAHPDVHGHTPREEDKGAEGIGGGDDGQPPQREKQAERADGLDGLPRDASDSRSNRLQAGLFPASHDKEGRQDKDGHAQKPAVHDGESLPADRWRDFPAQPPVRRRHDGLSPGVDDLAISWTRWRTESIKAYGNAIVPQVMYEIFRAIEMEENNGKHGI